MKNYLLCFLLFVVSTYNYAQSRFLDSSFGTDGKVVTNFGSEEGISGIAFQSDKKIVAGGYYDLIKKNLAFDWYVCALARYKTNGELDSSFGKNGIMTFDSSFSYLNAITVQQDDKIVGTGLTSGGENGDDNQLIVYRRKKNGEADSSFGNNGIAYSRTSQYNSYGTSRALQSDGKILAAGNNSRYYDTDSVFVVIVRFNKDGTLDSNFGNNGKKKIIVGYQSYTSAITINSKDEIIIAGYNVTHTNSDQPFLISLTSSGKLNNHFGNNGVVITQLNDVTIGAVVLTQDEKIIAGGSKLNSGNNNFCLVKYNKYGAIDSSFGMNGIVNSDLGYSDQVTSIVIQSDEKIIAAGNSFDAATNETYFALSRYNSNGMPDSTFGLKGRILTGFSGHNNTLSQVLLQPDGKIVAGGTSSIRRYGYGDFALSRYTNYNSEDNLQIPVASAPATPQENVITSSVLNKIILK